MITVFAIVVPVTLLIFTALVSDERRRDLKALQARFDAIGAHHEWLTESLQDENNYLKARVENLERRLQQRREAA